MTECRAATVDLSALPKLTGGQVIEARSARPAPELAAAARFGEGQLSGPFGPQFVGYGPLPGPSLRQRLLPYAFGFAVGLVAIVLEAAKGNI